MNKINTSLKSIIQLVKQTQLELTLSFVIAGVAILVQYSSQILRQIEKDSTAEASLQGTVSTLISDQFTKVNELPYANSISTALFWAVIALVVYISYLLISNIVIAARNEIAINTQKNHRLILRGMAKVASVLIFYTVVYISIKHLIPHWIYLAGLSINDGLAVTSLYYLFLGIIGLAWNVYVIWLFVKVVYGYLKTL